MGEKERIATLANILAFLNMLQELFPKGPVDMQYGSEYDLMLSWWMVRIQREVK